MTILVRLLTVLDMIVAIWFIFIVTIQTSKSEGLTGGGATTPSSARAKPGFEDHMSKLTLYSGVLFMALTAIIALLTPYTSAPK